MNNATWCKQFHVTITYWGSMRIAAIYVYMRRFTWCKQISRYLNSVKSLWRHFRLAHPHPLLLTSAPHSLQSCFVFRKSRQTLDSVTRYHFTRSSWFSWVLSKYYLEILTLLGRRAIIGFKTVLRNFRNHLPRDKAWHPWRLDSVA